MSHGAASSGGDTQLCCQEVSYCPPEGTTQPCILDACYHFDKQDSHIRGVKSTPSPSLLQFLAVSGEGRNGELVRCVVGF